MFVSACIEHFEGTQLRLSLLGCESTHPGIVKRVLNTIDYHQPTPTAAGNDSTMEVENEPPIYPHSATPAPAFPPVKRSAKKPDESRKAHSARTPTKAPRSSKKSGGMRSSSGVTPVCYSGPLDFSHLSLGTKPPPPGGLFGKAKFGEAKSPAANLFGVANSSTPANNQPSFFGAKPPAANLFGRTNSNNQSSSFSAAARLDDVYGNLGLGPPNVVRTDDASASDTSSYLTHGQDSTFTNGLTGKLSTVRIIDPVTGRHIAFKNSAQIMKFTETLTLSNALVSDEGGAKTEFENMYKGKGGNLSNAMKVNAEKENLKKFETIIEKEEESYKKIKHNVDEKVDELVLQLDSLDPEAERSIQSVKQMLDENKHHAEQEMLAERSEAEDRYKKKNCALEDQAKVDISKVSREAKAARVELQFDKDALVKQKESIEKDEEKNLLKGKAWLNVSKCGNDMLAECVRARECVRDKEEAAQHYAFERAQQMKSQLNQLRLDFRSGKFASIFKWHPPKHEEENL